MKKGPFLLLALLCLGGACVFPARAALVTVRSPDKGTTWAYGRLIEWSFRLDDQKKSLTVVTTYTNDLLADRTNPVEQDDLWFRFPGARYDAATGAYLVTLPSKKGKGHAKTLVVARRNHGLFQATTRLSPNAIVVVTRTGTRIRARLMVDPTGGRMPRSFVEVTRAAPDTLQGLLEGR